MRKDADKPATGQILTAQDGRHAGYSRTGEGGRQDVLATSRREDRRDMLLANGADEVFIDDGRIAPAVKAAHPDGVNRVLELVGTTTLLDSLQLTASGGSVCMTGMVGNSWEFERFSPTGAIPTAVNLTTYAGGSEDFIETPLQKVVDAVASARSPRANLT